MSERKSGPTRMPPPDRVAARPAGEEVVTSPQAALRALGQTGGLLRRISEPYFGAYGISAAQWGVLRSLSRLEARGSSCPTMVELGDALIVRPPSLSATLDRMARAGLIERRKDPQDQRTRRILLTAAGRSLVARVLIGHHQWIKGVMSGLSSKEHEVLLRLLTRLGEHMKVVADGRGNEGAGKGEALGSLAGGRRRST
ncbi:MAG: MarR family winged helix-turn-helix transcriptional regulator [Phycisphaerales bacterium]